MRSRVDPAVVEALLLHQPTGVRSDDIAELRTNRERKKAVKRMRKTWGAGAARSLELLQEAQIEFGRLLAAGSSSAFSQRDLVVERRRALDREIEVARRATHRDGPGDGTGRYVLDRLFGG